MTLHYRKDRKAQLSIIIIIIGMNKEIKEHFFFIKECCVHC